MEQVGVLLLYWNSLRKTCTNLQEKVLLNTNAIDPSVSLANKISVYVN